MFVHHSFGHQSLWCLPSETDEEASEGKHTHVTMPSEDPGKGASAAAIGIPCQESKHAHSKRQTADAECDCIASGGEGRCPLQQPEACNSHCPKPAAINHDGNTVQGDSILCVGSAGRPVAAQPRQGFSSGGCTVATQPIQQIYRDGIDLQSCSVQVTGSGSAAIADSAQRTSYSHSLSARQGTRILIWVHHIVCALYCLADVLVMLFVRVELMPVLDLMGPWLALQPLMVVWVILSGGFASFLVVGNTSWRKWLDTLPSVRTYVYMAHHSVPHVLPEVHMWSRSQLQRCAYKMAYTPAINRCS